MSDKLRVLFVDDDTILGSVITVALKELGYNILYVSSFISINNIINEFNPNIIVLDVEIDNKNGIEESAKIHKNHPNTPIIFVSSHCEVEYELEAIRSGGVNYIKKPIDIELLNAYIERHANRNIEKTVSFGEYVFNEAKRTITNSANNKIGNLSLNEAELLKLLVDNINNTVTREDILKGVFENDATFDLNINNYISKLRKHFSEDNNVDIKTVHGVGYMLTVLIED